MMQYERQAPAVHDVSARRDRYMHMLRIERRINARSILQTMHGPVSLAIIFKLISPQAVLL